MEKNKNYIKKICIVLITIGALACACYVFIVYRHTKLQKEAQCLATNLVSLYKPNARVDDTLSESVRNKVSTYLQKLQETEDFTYTVFDFDSEEQKEWESTVDTIIPDEPETLEADAEGLKEIRIDTPYVYKEGSELKVKVKDLVFEKGIADIVYDGVVYEVFKEDVPETYSQMLKNPKYRYKFIRQENINNTAVFYYSSMYDDTLCIITITYDKTKMVKITDFKVEMGD